MADFTHVVRTAHGKLTLNLNREYVELMAHNAVELDPAWEHVDAQGHRHTNLDALVQVVTSEGWCDDCRDVHEEHEWRCLLCRDVVEPRYITVTRPAEIMPGLLRGTATLRVEPRRRGFVAPTQGEWFLRPSELEALGPALSTGAIDDWVAALLLREPNVSSILLGSETGQTFVEYALILTVVSILVIAAALLGWL